MRYAPRVNGQLRLCVLLFAVLALVAGCKSGGSGSASVLSYAGFSGPGPKLSDVTAKQIDAAMRCFPAQGKTTRSRAVFLIHGTGLTAANSWDETYAKILPPKGYNVCTVDLPDYALGDIQISAEYVVAIIRRMYARYKMPIDVITHSQGGLEARWAMKYWPDIPGDLDDVVTLAAPNHGTVVANTVCLQQLAACTASVEQQRVGSKFLAALNRNESVPKGVSLTNVYSLTDEVVVEEAPLFTSAVNGASNILIQSICPVHATTHIMELADPVAYAIVMDAFTHKGPAEASRISPAVCGEMTAPGVDLTTFLDQTPSDLISALLKIATGPVSSEPPLKPYARQQS